MTTESTSLITPSTWFEEMVERTRLPRLQLATGLVLALALLLIAAAYLDGILSLTLNVGFWRVALGGPAMAAYVTLFQPVLKRWRDAAIQAFRPLGPVDSDRFRHALAQAAIFDRRNEIAATAVGLSAGLLAVRPWDRTGLAWTWSPVGQSAGLTLVGGLLTTLVYGFMGFFLYSILSGTRLFAELRSRDRRINAFDLESLQPIAAWSLGIALFFVGGITLALLAERSLILRVEQLIGYIAVTLAPVVVFFLNMQTVHSAMVQAKERELQMVRTNLVAASEALRQLPAEGTADEEKALFASIASWEKHQERVKALPDWPYTTQIRRNLALSSLLPALVGLAQGALPDLLQRFLPPQVLEILQQLLPLAW